MADAEDENLAIDESPEQHSENSGGKKKLLFIVLPILLLGGGGAGVYFSGVLDSAEKTVAQSEAPKAPPPPAKSAFFDLPDMLVNMNSAPSNPHFLKFQVSLELKSDFDITILKPLQPRIIDKFQVYMRDLRLDDLRASDGIQGLRKELLARINEVIEPVEVKDILFRNFLVQ